MPDKRGSGYLCVPRELAGRILERMEADFWQIDSEWGVGGEASADDIDEIRELRALLESSE